MSWTLLLALVLALGVALLAALSRRRELARMERSVDDRERAVRLGSARAQLQHPVIDLSRCLGCGTCVAACPEEGVLELVHGQAMVVNGSRCVGHARCERECPVGAIQVTIANLAERKDVPALTEQLEAIGSPGLFLAGELTAHALIKTAIEHGTRVAGEVASRVSSAPPAEDDVLDLCIVGAGPAGLACALEAKRLGLRAIALEQEPEVGGTVAKYPRRKLVLTQPVELPLHGRLERTEYTKEQLVELWQRIAREQELDIRTGETVRSIERGERDEHGGFVVRTDSYEYDARFVCLALGRRGTPNKLGVAGEELPKVAYGLLDARSYQRRRVLVVGGGDSAVETAVGLAEQEGNQVTLSYRREAFFRLRARNEQRLQRSLGEGRLSVLFASEVRDIRAHEVELDVGGPAGSRKLALPNDEVFVMAGGATPFELLSRAGVSFDPALRAPVAQPVERGTGLVRALAIGFAFAVVALAWALWNADYYMLDLDVRPADAKHLWLRPARGAGLFFGIAATALICVNLLYIVRRSPRTRFQFGSLKSWMTSHVATGILALLCATLHGAMAPRDTVGGHALAALVLLFVTGAIGRYFYAWVPRAANGRELELDEVKQRLASESEHWDATQRAYVERAREGLAVLIRGRQWRSSFLGRVLALLGGQRDLRELLARLASEGERDGVPPDRIQRTLHVARNAYRASVAAAHLEDLRAILNSWRYLHRWVAALMVALLVLHVVYALVYSEHLFDGGGRP